MQEYIQVYKDADKILSVLSNDKHHRMMEDGIYREFERDEHPRIRAAMHTIISAGYIKNDPPTSSYYMILGPGIALHASGGYKELFEKLNKQEEEDSIKKWYDTENAKQIFDDYPIIKRNAKISIIIAAISAAIALIAIMKK